MTTELDKNTFTRLYINEGMSLRKIAKMYGRSYMFAYHRKAKFGIPTQSWSTKKCISKQILKRLCVHEGMSTEQIAKQLSCSPSTVRKKYKEYGIHPKRQRVGGISKTLLEKLYVKEGKSTREVAKKLGCSYETIRKRCRQFGILARDTGTKKIEIDKTTLGRLYVKQEMSVSEIAQMFDCSFSVIYRKIIRMGLKKPEV